MGLLALTLRWLDWKAAAAIALAALLFNLFVMPRIGRGIYRDPSRKRDTGIVAYAAMVLLLTLLFLDRDLPIAAAVAVAEEKDQEEHHRGVGDDARVALPGRIPVDSTADPRHDEKIEEQSGERDGGRGLPVEPAQREREQAHPRMDGLALPFGGWQARQGYSRLSS